MNSLNKIFNEDTLLNPNPLYSAKVVGLIIFIFILMIAAGAISWYILKPISKKINPYVELRNKLTSMFLTTGIIGLFLALFGWQEIPYLSMRIMVLILLVIFIVWAIIILLYIKRKFSWELAKFKQDERYKKYLPHGKKHGGPNSKKRR